MKFLKIWSEILKAPKVESVEPTPAFKKENFATTLRFFSQLDGVSFVKKIAIDVGLMPDSLQFASHVATFPIYYENQVLGALLAPCPGG